MNVNNKIDFYIKYISNHPKASGNSIYNKFKGTKYGMRKTEFYKAYRNTKGISKPTPEKIIKSIPRKYRKKIGVPEKEKIPVHEIDRLPAEPHYNVFYEALETLVHSKLRDIKPDNYRDLEHSMYKFGFRYEKNKNTGQTQKAWPTEKQVKIGWDYLRSKGLTTR